jgi:hypothetical protein
MRLVHIFTGVSNSGSGFSSSATSRAEPTNTGTSAERSSLAANVTDISPVIFVHWSTNGPALREVAFNHVIVG